MPAGFSGCAFWRMRLPFAKLNSLGSDKIAFDISYNADKTVQMAEIASYTEDAAAVAMQAPGHVDAHRLLKHFQSQGKKVVIDYDDFSFDLDPGNPRYAELGIRECERKDDAGNIVYRWVDGENGFDLKANLSKYDGFKSCVQSADLVTVTTDYLASKFTPLNKNVVVCPNSVDFSLWKPLPRPDYLPKDQVRIGWFGGDSHYTDLKAFKNLLPRIMDKYPQVTLVLQCPAVPQWREFFEKLPPNRVEWHDWADLRFYTLFLGARNWDIGLCPLDSTLEFNKCKSNIKVLEFAAVGAPVVAQNMVPYSNYIQHGTTGMLAGSEQEWFDCLEWLILDVTLRQKMGRAAYEQAHEHFNLDKNCRVWEAAYFDLIEGTNVRPNGRPGVSDSQGCGAGS